MRKIKKYIDAEILKQQDFQDFSNTDVFNAINDCPAAKVRKITVGKWNDEFNCSNCGVKIYDKRYWVYNFCPNCGASMRGEQ